MRAKRQALKRSTILLVVICIISFNSVSVVATDSYEEYADQLNKLGIFKGTDNGYELDRMPTRVEAAVMFIRLCGAEELALEEKYMHPFKDVPTWADDYIGLLYHAKLTSGTSETTYGSNDTISAAMYMTFVLRALSYSDKDGDFIWDKSLEYANDLELIDDAIYSSLKEQDFLRAQLAQLSYLALKMPDKRLNITIAEKLILLDKIDVDLVVELGIVTPANAMAMIRSRQLTELSNEEREYIVPMSEEIIRCLTESDIEAFENLFSIELKNDIDFNKMIDKAFNLFECDTFVNADINDTASGGESWSYGKRVKWDVRPEIENIEVLVNRDGSNSTKRYYSIYYIWQITDEENKSSEGIQYMRISSLDSELEEIDYIEIGY